MPQALLQAGTRRWEEANMDIKQLTYDAAITKAKQLPYAWIIGLSEVYSGHTPETLNPSEWVEAHFFSSSQELRFMAEKEDLRAVLLTQEDGDLFINEDKVVDKSLSNKVQHFLIRKYIQTDRDGQANIAAVRLAVKEDA